MKLRNRSDVFILLKAFIDIPDEIFPESIKKC